MSTITFGSFGQAARTLDVVAEQKLSTEEVEVLNNGYLTDLARAIRVGTVPARDTFQKFLGLLPELKVWRTVRLGLHKIPDAYEKAFEAAGFRISDYALKILKKISVSQTEIELDLVVVTPTDLGLKNPTYQQICDRAVELGLEKCPREVGPVFRLDYPDQPFREWLWVAMEPEADSGGDLDVFRCRSRPRRAVAFHDLVLSAGRVARQLSVCLRSSSQVRPLDFRSLGIRPVELVQLAVFFSLFFANIVSLNRRHAHGYGFERPLKKKDTWCGKLRHCGAEFDSIRRVFNGWWHRRFAIHYRLGRQPERVQCRSRQRRAVA